VTLRIKERQIQLAMQAVAKLVGLRGLSDAIGGSTALARVELFAGKDRAARRGTSWQIRFLNRLREDGLIVREGEGKDTAYRAANLPALTALTQSDVRKFFIPEPQAPPPDPVGDPEPPPLSENSDREIIECCYQWITHLHGKLDRVEKKLDRLIEAWK
jgi:hypothetical protein